MFIPPGCVLLTAAVDRLAEARRTAAQANDDSKNAAQEELRGEFYNDTISPLVVSRSGKKYKIRPHHWSSEKAPTWFEQDEFWLIEHEYLVDPPLGMFHGKELAYIFVGEHDLQRLMAKQEVKQEAAPRLDGKMSKPPPLSGEPLVEHVEKPEPELLKPSAWFEDVRKDNQQHKNESQVAYAGRLHGLMQEAHAGKHVTKLWAPQTLLRRLFRDK